MRVIMYIVEKYDAAERHYNVVFTHWRELDAELKYREFCEKEPLASFRLIKELRSNVVGEFGVPVNPST